MSEFDTGYSVVIGKPVIHAEKKATGSSVSFPCEAIADGSYLVSLEVNGTVKAYRESLDFSSGSCTVGAYTLSYASYALTVSGTSNNDIVRVMVEPLEVKTTDAFRAAVKKDAPETPNELPAVAAADKGKYLHANESTGDLEWAEGGSGGGVLVVTDTDGTLDKTWQEIYDAAENGIPTALRVVEGDDIRFNWLESVFKETGGEKDTFCVDFGNEGVNFDEYAADSASGYPTKGESET